MSLPRGTERGRAATAPAAQWMTAEELAGFTYRPGHVLLGKSGGRHVGLEDDRHMLTVAGSRTGKSSTCLKPNLRLWPSSALVIDPKGELASDTATARAQMGQDVFVLDPFGEVRDTDAARFRVPFNPLDELRHTREEDIVDDAALMADALILPEKSGDQHWTLSAKNLIRGLILYVLAKGGDAGSLIDLRDVVSAPYDCDTGDTTSLLEHFELMLAENRAFGGVLAGVAGTMAGKPPNERGSIISTAIEQTAFLDSAPMRAHLAAGSFGSLRVLKQKPTTIYLVLPASRMATHFRWLRLILALAMAGLEREKAAIPGPVLFVLEEFPQLGYMRQIEAAAGLMAGYGVKLWTVLQDLSQIKALYRDSWETFIGNAGAVQAFGNTDATTLDYLSRALGDLRIVEKQAQPLTASAMMAGQPGEREQYHSVPLLAPFEIAQYCARETGKQIILFAGRPPAFIDRITHREVEGMG